jgi:NADH-quinone oxidoreductase subunit E
VIAVCHNLSCSLRGAEDIVAHLEARLGIEAGETTADGRVTLLRVECLCACEAAPMMQVDDAYVGPLDRAGVDRALEGLR